MGRHTIAIRPLHPFVSTASNSSSKWIQIKRSNLRNKVSRPAGLKKYMQTADMQTYAHILHLLGSLSINEINSLIGKLENCAVWRQMSQSRFNSTVLSLNGDYRPISCTYWMFLAVRTRSAVSSRSFQKMLSSGDPYSNPNLRLSYYAFAVSTIMHFNSLKKSSNALCIVLYTPFKTTHHWLELCYSAVSLFFL